MNKHHIGILENFNEDLTVELLKETADRFFGARKEIEEMRETFDRYVAELRQLQQRPLKRMAVLRAVLLDREDRICAFWDAIGIPARAFDTNLRLPPAEPVDFPKLRRAWTLTGRYTWLVLDAYSQLHAACDQYRHCRQSSHAQSNDPPPSCYDMVIAMAKLLNDKIQAVNDTFSVECTLQFVRSLDVRAQEAEEVTGGLAGRYATGLVDRLCVEPVDIEALDLLKFPVPPLPDSVEGSIRSFCKQQVRLYKKDILTRIPSFARP